MTTPSLWVQEMKKSWHQLSTSLQSDVIIYAGPLFNDQEMIFQQKMENSEKKNPNGILFLSTYGGALIAHSGYAGCCITDTPEGNYACLCHLTANLQEP